MPFEEWIYGRPPQDVQFVRVNGNRVIRVEIAKVGQPLEVFTKDEVEGLMTTDGKPVLADASHREEHKVEMGDVTRNPNTQAPTAPPTLRAPGEKLPTIDSDSNAAGTLNREGPMKPVVFPKDTTNDAARTVDAHPAAKPDAAKPASANPDSTSSDASKTGTGSTDGAKKPASEAPAAPDTKPATTPAQPATAPPSSNFYSEKPQPAVL
jgi:hypothetical protein